MDKRKLIVGIIAGLMAAVMIFGLIAMAIPPAGAEKSSDDENKSSSEIKDEIEALKEEQEKNREQLATLQGQLSENLNEIGEMVAQKNNLDQQVFLLYQQEQNLTKQITAYNSLIADKQAELDVATAHYEDLCLQYKERVRAMEENGSVSYWSVLFQANNFSDLLDRLNMIEEIASADQRRMKELDEAAKAVVNAKAELETNKIALEVSKKDLEATTEAMEVSKSEADALLKDLIAQGEEYQALIDKHEEIESESLKELEEKEIAYDKAKEKEYQEWLAAQTPPKPSVSINVNVHKDTGISWVLPISYTQFSSPFGWRTHPIYGDTRFHAGVDLSAPTGTPIVATRAGVVTVASFEAGGAGYYVNINHLDDYVTRYMHMTHYIVEPGQTVSAGQVIGYCGSTGASTGPHLHFGVYYKGSAVNPAQYINIG